MSSMTGTYEHSIDAKGRLFIPAKLREELGVTFYPSSALHPVNTTSEHKIAAIIRSGNNLTLEITDQASASFLSTLLGVIRNTQ